MGDSWSKRERGGFPYHHFNTWVAQATTNTPQYPLIRTTSPEFFGSRRGLFRHSARPAKGAHAPIRRAPQALAPTRPHLANNAHLGSGSNTTRNFLPRQAQIFTPIPMTYRDFLPSLITNQLVVVIPGRVPQPPFPKWYNPSATCAYHGGALGHSVEQCLALKNKVQSLIEARWLTFQEDGPNIKANPLANHGGGAVNAIEVSRSHKPKLLKDVTTSRRFIYEALQKAGVIPLGEHKEDSCLMHPGVLHDMETCPAIRDLLQQMIDQG